jgi:hypothetical protein
MRRDLGAEAAGQSVAAHGIAGTVERIGTPPAMSELLIRLSEPVPGYLQFATHGPDEGPAMTIIIGSDVVRAQPDTRRSDHAERASVS